MHAAVKACRTQLQLSDGQIFWCIMDKDIQMDFRLKENWNVHFDLLHEPDIYTNIDRSTGIQRLKESAFLQITRTWTTFWLLLENEIFAYSTGLLHQVWEIAKHGCTSALSFIVQMDLVVLNTNVCITFWIVLLINNL